MRSAVLGGEAWVRAEGGPGLLWAGVVAGAARLARVKLTAVGMGSGQRRRELRSFGLHALLFLFSAFTGALTGHHAAGPGVLVHGLVRGRRGGVIEGRGRSGRGHSGRGHRGRGGLVERHVVQSEEGLLAQVVVDVVNVAQVLLRKVAAVKLAVGVGFGSRKL
ncbi:hypothetical protein BC567DRAFT_222815 [Phyllosticta citribraziliensis]